MGLMWIADLLYDSTETFLHFHHCIPKVSASKAVLRDLLHLSLCKGGMELLEAVKSL